MIKRMLQTKTILWLIGLPLFLATSCAPVYVPNARNAPLFRGGGEFQGSVQFGSGIDVQAAASVTDHIGLMANFATINRNSGDDDADYLRHRILEGGIGYYSNTDKLCYEVFAGFGKGEGTTYDNYDFINSTADVKATGHYNRFFFQPAIGTNNHIFNWCVAFRVSIVNLTDFTKDDVAYNPPNNDPFIFFEPCFIGKLNFGDSGIYANFQSGFSLLSQNKAYFDYSPVNLNIGIGVRFGGQKKLDYRE